MKSINTLVPDIYELFTSGKINKDNFEKLLVNPDNAEERSSSANLLRMSSLGTVCERQLYYKAHSPSDGEPMEAPQLIKFMFGDMLESFILQLAVMAGHTVEGSQDQLELHGVKGHRDAIIDGCLVDVKSASTYSFKKFKEGLTVDNDAFGYITQINAYLAASQEDKRLIEKEKAYFLAIDKTLGNMCLSESPRVKVDWKEFIEAKSRMLEAKEPPKRHFKPDPDGKSGNEKLGVNCSYCAFKRKCWPGLRTFVYFNGPVFLTKVAREPNVSEVK